jgi:hypothetical protein
MAVSDGPCYPRQMLIFPVALVVAVMVCFRLDSVFKPTDYNSYIRQLKLNIPGVSDDLFDFKIGRGDRI